MAILTGFNIGANQKGILNLGSTINTPLSATLQSVTDGMGVASPLQLSNAKVLLGTTAGSSPQTINIGETNRFGSALFSNTYILFDDWMELRGNSGVRLPVSNLVIGTTTATARLHVRGDGTNPVARFENSAGTAAVVISSDALTLSARNHQIGNNSNLIQAFAGAPDPNGAAILFTSIATTSQLYAHNFVSGTRANLSGTSGQLSISGTFAAGAGSGNFRPAGIEYTINNSGAQTGTATGIFLNATETALNGMTHNLMDLQVGGVSRFEVGRILDIAFNFNDSADRFSLFSISRVGSPATPVLFFGSGSGPTGTQGRIAANGDNLALGTVASGTFTERLIVTTTNLIAFGGTTNAFPALKRNAAALEVRLADDSGFADLNVKTLTCSIDINNVRQYAALNNASFPAYSFASNSGTGMYSPSAGNLGLATNGVNRLYINSSGNILINTTTDAASAIFNIESTTKGFLPPRMTTTQVNGIATPAEGLVVFNTTISHLCVYQGGVWVRINHSPM